MRYLFKTFVAMLFVCILFAIPAQAQQVAGKIERQNGTANRSADGTVSELALGS